MMNPASRAAQDGICSPGRSRYLCQIPSLSRRRAAGKAGWGILIGLAATLLVTLAAQLTWPNYLELKLLDVRHRWFPAAQDHPDLVTVVINDNSLEQIGRWPWPRRHLARLVETCHQAQARQVLLDITLPDEQLPEIHQSGLTDQRYYEPNRPPAPGSAAGELIDNDGQLVRSIERAGNVILPFYAHLQPPDTPSQDYPRPTESWCRAVEAILRQQPAAPFPQVYRQLRPQADPRVRDPEFQQILQAYGWSVGMQRLAGLGLDRPDQAPGKGTLYHLGEPTPPFARLLTGRLLDVGFVSSLKDPDGVVRRMPLLAEYQGKLYRQLAFAGACRALGIAAEDIDLNRPGWIILAGQPRQIPLDEQGQMIIAWTGSDWRHRLGSSYIPITRLLQAADLQQALAKNRRAIEAIGIDRQTLLWQLEQVPADISDLDEQTRKLIELRRIQLADLVELEQANEQLSQNLQRVRQDLQQLLAGKIVLVGSVATGAPDFVVTPHSDLTPGIVVHRNVLNTILQGAFLRRMPRWAELGLVLLLGGAMTVVAAGLRPLASGLAVGILTPLWLGVNFAVLFGQMHIWAAAVSPAAAILASFTAVTFYRQVTEGRAKRRITARFKQYAPPTVVDRIVSQHRTVSLAGETRELSCFFSDLEGFTRISEQLGPEKTVSVLNRYLDRMTEVLDRYYATINKFEGDGIFAFFGAPVDLPDHARLACLAALDAQRELDRLVGDQRRVDPEFPELRKRVGISTGPAVVGDCGSQRRFDYTAIGDTVNFAARLESANKQFGSRILICQETFRQAAEVIRVRCLGRVRVVGKTQAVELYEVRGPADNAGEPAAGGEAAIERFEQAIRTFQQGQFERAVAQLEAFLQERPDDKAARLYLRIATQHLRQGTPDSFDGSIGLSEK
ncbi:MAG: CHASE2 domain-containing protein [Sedimentisphaerales bacterium]|nr:CHASE2 domain-containing protein [Sedimentisphaerales bacterium]